MPFFGAEHEQSNSEAYPWRFNRSLSHLTVSSGSHRGKARQQIASPPPPQVLDSRPDRSSVFQNRRCHVKKFVRSLWNNEEGQDIAEYAVMLAVILVIVVGTIRLIGSNANNVFSSVGSAIQ